MPDQFTEDEIKRIRALLEADKRRVWLVQGIKAVSLWITALAAGYLALKGVITDLVAGTPR